MQMLFSKKWAFVAVGEGPAFFNTWNTETHSSMSMLGWRNAWFQAADGGCGSTRRGRNGTGASVVWRGHPAPLKLEDVGQSPRAGSFFGTLISSWDVKRKSQANWRSWGTGSPCPWESYEYWLLASPNPFLYSKKKKKKRSESEVSRTR